MLAMTSARPQFADLFTMLPGLAVVDGSEINVRNTYSRAWLMAGSFYTMRRRCPTFVCDY